MPPLPADGDVPPRPWRRARVYVIPLILLLVMTIPYLHRGDWRRTDTGRYAAVGLEAWRSGELWTLHAEPGDPYFNKPPLAIWIHGLSVYAFGVGPWGVRLPGVLAAAVCVVSVVALTGRLAGSGAALWTGVVLALSYDFMRRVRSISLDLWQLLFMVLAVWIVVAACRGGNRRPGAWFALAGVPLGLALLCKPLVALLVPAVLAAWLAWTGRRRLIPALGWMTAAAVAVAAPWHISMILLHGDAFVGTYFGMQIADRAAGKLTSAPFDAKPWWYYLEHIGTTHWPWLLLVALSGVRWFRFGRLSPSGDAERLALVWSAAWLLVLTLFADRRDRYALPLMPSMAMLAGLWINGQGVRWLTDRGLDILGALAVVLAPLGAMVPVGGDDREPAPWRELYAWIDARAAERGELPELWQGAFALDRRARVYLRFGRWPRATRNERGEFVVDRVTAPPAGAFLLYQRRDGLAPGPNETEVFAAGDLRVTRLGDGGWNPLPIPDPGER